MKLWSMAQDIIFIMANNLKRNITSDNICKQGFMRASQCVMCLRESESLDNLFVSYSFSNTGNESSEKGEMQ